MLGERERERYGLSVGNTTTTYTYTIVIYKCQYIVYRHRSPQREHKTHNKPEVNWCIRAEARGKEDEVKEIHTCQGEMFSGETPKRVSCHIHFQERGSEYIAIPES